MTAELRAEATTFTPIDISEFPLGTRTNFYLPLCQYATGQPMLVPFTVARGAKPGPTLGISAAVHGNELNGIKIIQNMLATLDVTQLTGALVCAPVVNIPGFDSGKRYFSDGHDLNKYFPGKAHGLPAEQYARAFVETFLPPLDFLIDIHTASEGRLNTLYVRADLENEDARKMARLVNPEIVLDNRGGDGTLRAAARERDIPAITVEAGNPNVIQGRMVFDGETGIYNVMVDLKMIEGECRYSRQPVVCESSRWLRTTGGGVLETMFRLGQRVRKDQLLARTMDPFGNALQLYHAPADGIVIGKSAYPVAIPGTRFCHLGIIAQEDEASL
jgi:predicted deacylase